MRTTESTVGVFRKVGECLLPLFIERCLLCAVQLQAQTCCRKRKSGRPIAHREGLRCASDRWLKTIQDSKPKTLEQKSYIVDRIKKQWPTGSLVEVAKIKPSDCDLWLARCAQKSRNGFRASSRNAHVQILKEVFALALRDKIISDSPAAMYSKCQKPIRLTPTWEHFKAIISDVRAQVFNT